MRLIDADALVQVLDEVLAEQTKEPNFISVAENSRKQYMVDFAKQMIGDAPTVDAEPVQPSEFEWCHDCKEYDQSAHCCHRWTKVIRNTVNELKTQGYEPVRYGYWKVVKSSIYPYGNDVACSVCGFKMGSSFGYDFCPHCGAKMDEEDNDAETD